jgi:hypothetical protein
VPSTGDHDRLVEGLANLLDFAGFVIMRGDLAGFRRALPVGGRRPDLVAIRLDRADKVIGEAKTPDDIFSDRSLDQYEAFSDVPVPGRRMNAHLVVAVPGYHALRAWRALELAGAAGRRVTVVGKLPGRWWITYQPQDGAATWPRFAVATPVPSGRFAVRCSLSASGAGGSTGTTSPGVQT